MYGIGVFESLNGKYYVAEGGNKLHVDPLCQYLYYSKIVMRDATRTLAWRIKRGDSITGPNGRLIVAMCWICSVDHAEIAQKLARRVIRVRPDSKVLSFMRSA